MNTITINERVYRIQPMRADEKAALGLDLLPVVAGPIGQILRSKEVNIAELMQKFEGGKMKEGVMDDAEIMKVLAVFIDLIPILPMDTVKDLFFRALMSVSCIDGNLSDEPTRDIYFGQHEGDYYPVCLWALWENTKGFLVGSIPGMKGIFLGSVAKQSESPSPTNGPSSGSSRPSTRRDSAPSPMLKRG